MIIETSETIAAIATAHGVGAISVIRVSGDDAIDICDRVFVSAKNKKLKDAKSHTVLFGKIVSEDKTIDEVLVLQIHIQVKTLLK